MKLQNLFKITWIVKRIAHLEFGRITAFKNGINLISLKRANKAWRKKEYYY